MKSIFRKKQRMPRLAYTAGLLSLVLAVILSLSAGGAQAADMFQTEPGLGGAGSFAVLGAQTVTNTGSSVVNGDLGLYPGEETSVEGFPPGTVTGEIHAGDAVAQEAQADVTTAYNILDAQPCDENLTGQDLGGGRTLTPGVYCFDSSAQLTGKLTLDAQGDEWSVFIFKMGSTLTTASGSSVEIINGENLCNLFWQVGSSATLGTTTAFKGNILALTSITLNNGATIMGRALARNAAVTMDTNTITIPVCAVEPTPEPTEEPTTEPTSEPTSEPTTEPTAEPTTEPESLPDTGGDLDGPGSQIIRFSLGALGLTLILFGFILSRRTQKTDR